MNLNKEYMEFGSIRENYFYQKGRRKEVKIKCLSKSFVNFWDDFIIKITEYCEFLNKVNTTYIDSSEFENQETPKIEGTIKMSALGSGMDNIGNKLINRFFRKVDDVVWVI